MRTLKSSLLALLIMSALSMAIRANPMSCGFQQWLGSSNIQPLGNCNSDPALYKAVKHQVLWWKYSPVSTWSDTTYPITKGHGGCAYEPGVSTPYQECWPIFFEPTQEYRADYCGDIFVQRVRSQHAGTYDPGLLTPCVAEPSKTWNFDCVTGQNTTTWGYHGTCLSPSTEDDCQAAEWYWSSNNTCEDTSICPYGQIYDSQAGECCDDPPPVYQCDAIIPETNCPYDFVEGCGPSPVLVDVLGNGFQMTGAVNGVDFDIDGNSDHVSERLSWTQAATDDAWLVLDRNGNGGIDSGREMFGNYTPQSQPAGTARNGFLALAEYDKAAKGGNGDGVINKDDDVFKKLRLWQDTNHNGISEPSELHKLKELDLKTLDLDYKESKKTDQYGNQFRYRAKVKDSHDAQMGRWAWDVFLVRQ